MHERNQAIPEIITLNINDYDHFYPKFDPISDDEVNVDASVGLPHS